MTWLPRSFRRSDEARLNREIDFHVDASTDAKVAGGLPYAEARRQALIELGGYTQTQQQVRETHLHRWLEVCAANARSAIRFIRRSPAFALTIVMTLTLGIGVNSAVFSAIDAIVLRPLPYPHAEELVRIHQLDLLGRAPEYFVAPPRLEDWDRLSTSFQCISGYYTGDATLIAGEFPEKITVPSSHRASCSCGALRLHWAATSHRMR